MEAFDTNGNDMFQTIYRKSRDRRRRNERNAAQWWWSIYDDSSILMRDNNKTDHLLSSKIVKLNYNTWHQRRPKNDIPDVALPIGKASEPKIKRFATSTVGTRTPSEDKKLTSSNTTISNTPIFTESNVDETEDVINRESNGSDFWKSLSGYWLGTADEEICSGCGQPFVLADHSGMLKCFNKDCRNKHHRIFVTDGDVQHLPFGADTVYHSVFGQKNQDAYVVFRPVIKQNTGRFSSKNNTQNTVRIELVQVNTNNAIPTDVRLGKQSDCCNDIVGGIASANAATIAPRRDAMMAHLEVVFGYAKRMKRTQVNNTTSTNEANKISNKTSANVLKRKDCLKLPDESIILSSDYTPDINHVRILRMVLCDNTCRKLGNKKCIRWGDVIENEKITDDRSPTERTPSQLHANCSWFSKPINISEFRILANKLCDSIGSASGHLSLFVTNPYFLQRIYLSVYDRLNRPPRLSDVELKRANILFQEASSRTSPNSPALIAINTKRIPATFIWSRVFEHMFPYDLIMRQLFACPTDTEKFKALMSWWSTTKAQMSTVTMITHVSEDGSHSTQTEPEPIHPTIEDKSCIYISPSIGITPNYKS